METTLRYGIIGTGMMGVEHINNILKLPHAAITAVADNHPESLDWAQLGVGLEQPLARFSDYRDLLDSEMCDVVVIATPNFTHVDVLTDVLATDLHVMVEKPLFTTVADCLKVIGLQDARASTAPYRCVWMGLEYRFMPPTQRLLAEVRGGTLGDVRMVAIREHRFPFLPKVRHWNRFNRNTGGTLIEKCCHFFDLMNLVIGTIPLRVIASGGQDVNHLDERYDGERPDILDNAYVIVDYPDGVRAVLDLCMFAEASRNEQEISVVGTVGKAEALVTDGVLRVGLRAGGIGSYTESAISSADIQHLGLHHGASYLEHVAFAAAIRSQQPAAVTLADGLWSVAIGQAAHQSIALGRWVELGELELG